MRMVAVTLKASRIEAAPRAVKQLTVRTRCVLRFYFFATRTLQDASERHILA
jgi:hypothetical protein